DTGTMTSVFVVHILHDLFASFVLKIHVYIGWLIPGIRHEPCKEQVNLFRIHRSDAQAVAYGRICSRTTSLAKYIFFSCKTYQIVDRQEIRGIILSADEF